MQTNNSNNEVLAQVVDDTPIHLSRQEKKHHMLQAYAGILKHQLQKPTTPKTHSRPTTRRSPTKFTSSSPTPFMLYRMEEEQKRSVSRQGPPPTPFRTRRPYTSPARSTLPFIAPQPDAIFPPQPTNLLKTAKYYSLYIAQLPIKCCYYLKHNLLFQVLKLITDAAMVHVLQDSKEEAASKWMPLEMVWWNYSHQKQSQKKPAPSFTWLQSAEVMHHPMRQSADFELATLEQFEAYIYVQQETIKNQEVLKHHIHLYHLVDKESYKRMALGSGFLVQQFVDNQKQAIPIPAHIIKALTVQSLNGNKDAISSASPKPIKTTVRTAMFDATTVYPKK